MAVSTPLKKKIVSWEYSQNEWTNPATYSKPPTRSNPSVKTINGWLPGQCPFGRCSHRGPRICWSSFSVHFMYSNYFNFKHFNSCQHGSISNQICCFMFLWYGPGEFFFQRGTTSWQKGQCCQQQTSCQKRSNLCRPAGCWKHGSVVVGMGWQGDTNGLTSCQCFFLGFPLGKGSNSWFCVVACNIVFTCGSK